MVMMMITNYLSFKPGNEAMQQDALHIMEQCVADIRKWMIRHRLMIKGTKTEFMLLGNSSFKNTVEAQWNLSASKYEHS